MISDLTLENAVIGGLLIDPSKAMLLSESDFVYPDNRKIFCAMLDMSNKKETIDVLTIHDKLKIGTERLFEKINSIHSTTNLKDEYIPRLRKITQKRNLINLIESKREELYVSEKDITEICYDLLESIKSVGIDACETEWNLGTSIKTLLEELEESSKKGADEKLYLGLRKLDYILAGLHKTDLTILAARPSVGKTAFSFQMAKTLAEKGNNVLYISIEMSDKELLKRLLSTSSGINSNRIRLPHTLKPEDFSKIVTSASELSSLPLYIDDKSSLLSDIIKKCIEMKESGKLDVVIIDYLQLIRIKGGGDNRDQQIGSITRSLKALSKELNVPIVVLSQLNRKAEDHSKPSLSNLRESGSIEQDADNVVFLHIDKNTSRTDTYMPIEVIVAKQRNGSVGYVEMFFHAKCFRFIEEIPETPRQATSLI
jgi:replicative DNA helicase